MLDDQAYKDRAPFDVTTLIEGEVQALADSRAGAVPRAPLRRYPAAADRAAAEQAGKDLAELALPPAEASAGAAGTTPDFVNHPPHYTSHPSGVECIVITEWMNFNVGNAVKYLWRSGEKGFQIQDLRKARWYIDREIARLEKLRDG